MKAKFGFFTALVAILAIVLCSACQRPLANQDLSSPEQAVVTSAKEFKQIYNSHDKEKMANLISQDASLLIGRDNSKHIVTKEEYLNHFPERWDDYPKFSNKFSSIDFNSSKDRATLHTYISIGGKRINIDWEFSRENGKWLLSGYNY